MTAHELLATCRQAGIVLRARGDALEVDAPRGVLTPELRAALVHHKPDLLAALRPTEFVTLKGGLTVAVQALKLALDLEARGFRQFVTPAGEYKAEPATRLSESDRTAITRWRFHLTALVRYKAPTAS